MGRLARVVFTWLSTEPGGAEESVRTLAAEVGRRYGLRPAVVFWQYAGLPPAGPAGGGVEWRPARSYEEYVRELGRTLAESPAGTVLFGNHRTFPVDVPAARAREVRCAVVFRAIPLPGNSMRYLSPATGRLTPVPAEAVDWQAVGAADAVVGISDAAADALRGFVRPPGRVGRIYNGVDRTWFRPPGRVTARPRVRRLLVACRLVPWKAAAVAVGAALRLMAETPGTTLDVLGGGPQAGELAALAARHGVADRVSLRGWQDDPRPWYRRADCLVHASPAEGFGRVVAEANAGGLVAVACRSGGTGEQVVDGHTGFTFDPGDVDGCYAVLKRFAGLPRDERARMARRAWRRCRALFHVGRAAEEYAALADRLVRLGGTEGESP